MPSVGAIGFQDPFDGRDLRLRALLGSADFDAALNEILAAPQVSTAAPPELGVLRRLAREADLFEENKGAAVELGRLVGDSFIDGLETSLDRSWQQLRDVRARLGLAG